MTSYRARACLALLLAAALVGGCSTGDGDKKVSAASASNRSAPTTTTEPPKVAAPLTGTLVEADAVDRPAVSIKVDNSPQARPQAGLDRADVIFEEKVEGGVTRFIAVYHSQEADLVGPIRSLRTSDPAIVSAVGGVFVFSDGVAKSLARLKGAPVSTVSERDGAAPFTYPKGKRRPLATYGATAELRAAGKGGSAPRAIFDFLPAGTPFTAAGATPATRATVDFGGKTTAGVEWDAGSNRWLRLSNGAAHNLSDGSRLSFTNVIIQRTPYKGAGYNDSAGFKVDEAVVVGSGEGIVLAGGKQVKVTWSKAGPSAPTVYTDSTGARVRLLPGNTLVVLPPSANAVSVV